MTTRLSARSERVRQARRLLQRPGRERARRFLVEGPQGVREALATDVVVELFASDAAALRHPELLAAAQASGVPVRPCDDDAIEALAETVTPQGLVAVCRLLGVPLTDVVRAAPRLVAVLARVRDPGNAGTVIRCADAAGADAVVLTNESVDVHNGKAVRASAGSVFHLPLVVGAHLRSGIEALRGAGLTVLAADGSGRRDLDDVDANGLLSRPTAWVFGNEAWGMPAEDLALADEVVRVPIHGRAESLNLATAAAVCLYASARAQRRTGRSAAQ